MAGPRLGRRQAGRQEGECSVAPLPPPKNLHPVALAWALRSILVVVVEAMSAPTIRKRRRNPIKAIQEWLRRVATPPIPPPGHLTARAVRACDVTMLEAVAGQRRLEADVHRAQLAVAESERHRANLGQRVGELSEEVMAAKAVEQGCGTEVRTQQGRSGGTAWRVMPDHYRLSRLQVAEQQAKVTQLESDLASAHAKHDAASRELRAQAVAQRAREAAWDAERAQLRTEAERCASATEERAERAERAAAPDGEHGLMPTQAQEQVDALTLRAAAAEAELQGVRAAAQNVEERAGAAADAAERRLVHAQQSGSASLAD